MSEDDSPLPFERTVVVLDAASGGLAALEAASAFAESIASRLDVLFIEEEDLHRLAAFPFARELTLRESTARTLDPASIARDLRLAAERARAITEAAARVSRLQWRFEVMRGRIGRALTEVCVSTNLVAIESRPNLAIERLLTAEGDAAEGSLLVVGRRAVQRKGSIVIHCDDSALAAAARAIALRLERQSGQPVREVPELDDFLAAVGVPLPRPQPWRPGAFATAQPAVAIVARATWPDRAVLDLLLREATCPVLLPGRGARA